MIGVFVDNELDYGRVRESLYSPSCSKAFAQWLPTRYASVDALNRAWACPGQERHYAAFGDVASAMPRPQDHGDPVVGDFEAFARHMVKTFVDFSIATIRKYDPKVLVISNRFNAPQSENSFEAFQTSFGLVADLFSAYDLIGFNMYPTGRDHFTRDELDALQWLHGKTGKPILIGEWGISSEDTGIISPRWRYQTVPTMEDRKRGYENCLHQLVSLPYVVGAHWFKWANGYGIGGQAGKDGRNCGFLQDDNRPYLDFVDHVKKVNAEVVKAKRKPDFTVDDIRFRKCE